MTPNSSILTVEENRVAWRWPEVHQYRRDITPRHFYPNERKRSDCWCGFGLVTTLLGSSQKVSWGKPRDWNRVTWKISGIFFFLAEPFGKGNLTPSSFSVQLVEIPWSRKFKLMILLEILNSFIDVLVLILCMHCAFWENLSPWKDELDENWSKSGLKMDYHWSSKSVFSTLMKEWNGHNTVVLF